MILFSVPFLLIPGILFGLTISSPCYAAPTTYDQRQEGKYNIHADLENFLIIVATSGRNDLLSDLAIQALELQDIASRSKSKSPEEKKQPSEIVVYETDEEHIGKEPYHVEIVRIEKEEKKKSLESVKESGNIEQAEKEEEKFSPGVTEQLRKVEDQSQSDEPIDSDKEEKKGRSLWKDSSRKQEEVPGKEKDLKSADRGKDSDELETLEQSKDDILKNGKPGASLKKQLSKKEQENVYSPLKEKNDVPSHEDKPQELKLLGGGIENCGPGRYRDNFGICQVDKNFNTQ